MYITSPSKLCLQTHKNWILLGGATLNLGASTSEQKGVPGSTPPLSCLRPRAKKSEYLATIEHTSPTKSQNMYLTRVQTKELQPYARRRLPYSSCRDSHSTDATINRSQ